MGIAKQYTHRSFYSSSSSRNCFVRAVTKGAQFAASNEAATRDINLQFTNLNPALKDKVLLPRLGTAINLKEMSHTIAMMQKYGLLKSPVDLSKRVFAP